MSRHKTEKTKDKNEDSTFFGRLAKRLFFLVPTLLKLGLSTTRLFHYEIAVAKKSLGQILILAGIAICLLLAAWLSFLILLFFYFISLPLTPFQSIFIIFLFNLALLVWALHSILKLKKRLFLPATRYQLERMKKNI